VKPAFALASAWNRYASIRTIKSAISFMTPEEARQHVEHWALLGPLLEQQEAEELRAYDEERRRRDIAVLLDLAMQFPTVREESGFQQQQSYFHRLAE
jgi:hypothetical protein